MQAKSDSNYVAVTRHRRWLAVSSSQQQQHHHPFVSSCPPILRVLNYNNNNSNNSHHSHHNVTNIQLDDDDIWFSAMGSASGTNGASMTYSNRYVGGGSDYDPQAANGSTNRNGDDDMDGDGNVYDSMNHHPANGNMMMMDPVGGGTITDDVTSTVAAHSSISANVANIERRRREDGWNDLGLDVILPSLRNHSTTTLLSSSSAANVVPFSSDSTNGSPTEQQQRDHYYDIGEDDNEDDDDDGHDDNDDD